MIISQSLVLRYFTVIIYVVTKATSKIEEAQNVDKNDNYDVHKKFHAHELRHVFGVDEMHEVPAYDLVTFKRSPAPLSNEKIDRNLEMKFEAFNDAYHVVLEPNEKFLSPNLLSVIRNGSESKLYYGLPKSTGGSSCHYRGHVVSHGNASVAMSVCGLTRGTIIMPDHFLVIHPLPDRLRSTVDHGHVIFKRSPTLSPLLTSFQEDVVLKEQPATEFCEVNGKPSQRPITAENKDDDGSSEKSARVELLTLELALFLDAELWSYFVDEFGEKRAEQELIDFSLALINNVYLLYQQSSMTPKLDVVLVRFELWKKQPDSLQSKFHKTGEAQLFLDAFCTFQTKINVGTDAEDHHWDHATLLTGYNIYHSTPSVAGVAPVARMCDPTFSCSLVEGMHLGRSFVLAHEMGHNLGMVHDGVQNQCSKSCCLMSAVNGAGKTTWSPCSVSELMAYVESLGKSGSPPNCLADAHHGDPAKDHKINELLPGQRFSADEQCSFFWGKGYKNEIPAGKSKSEICVILWCSNGGSTISTAHPALEGTWCGDQNWCLEGNCVKWPGNTAPRPVNGAWSEWSSLPAKSSVCSDCKVKGGLKVRREMRNCDSPAPNNGGTECAGSFIRGFVCEGPSSCESFQRESYSNGVCAALKSDAEKPDPELNGKSFQHPSSPCKVWCHLGETQLIRNKGFYPDGTPCGSEKYCVNGECLDLACGGNALVFDSPIDCPIQSGSFGWSVWGNWNQCTATCGSGGTQVRKRLCISPKIPGSCPGSDQDSQSCKSDTPCDNWKSWTSWGDCSATCGKGIRLRTRLCPNGASCDGAAIEHNECNNARCPQWASWSDWSTCSKSCDGGERARRRVCDVNNNDCPGPGRETESCNSKVCPEWGLWSSWSECSQSCGNGQTERRRSCLTGSDCTGTHAEVQPCRLTECSSDSRSDWSSWSSCSVTCGGGNRRRQRICSPVDGNSCRGSVVEEQRCNAIECQFAAVLSTSWTSWSAWSACSSNCGIGLQGRTRTCGSSSCDGQHVDEKKCFSLLCTSNNKWLEWSTWTDCSATCGSGQRNRKRECSAPGQCSGLADDQTPCQNQPCDQHPEMWGPWEVWSVCSKPCGGGLRQRTRYCNIGNVCPFGGGIEVEGCNSQTCTQGSWSDWSDWGVCTKNCGGGQVSRSRTCLAPDERQCGGFKKEERSCNERQCDDSYSSKRPEWSTWTQWSECSCFSNRMMRRRFCKVYEPKLLGFCLGPVLDERDCTPSNCAPIVGGWSTWSEWSACSADCGADSSRVRSRLCSNPVPSNRGTYCLGQSFEKQACSWQSECSGPLLNGGWSDWSEWTACSVGCGKGHRTRARYCDSPAPENGGLTCHGSDFSFESCHGLLQCQSPVSGSWGQWTEWGTCSQTCGFAFRQRQRLCNKPAPRNGGTTCAGIAHMTKICALSQCHSSLDGGWSVWSAWKDCSSSCGLSSSSRIRECDKPKPKNSGIPCLGVSVEERNCRDVSDKCLQTLKNFQNVESTVKKWDYDL